MAAAEPVSRPQGAYGQFSDRYSRIKPFAWMKRLANRRNAVAAKPRTGSKKAFELTPSKAKKLKSNPQQLPEDANPVVEINNGTTFELQEERIRGSFETAPEHSDEHVAVESYRSRTPTVATIPETVISDGDRQSKAGTSNTAGGGNSIFSSPNHSSRSLTTTLTTIQSQAPSAPLAQTQPIYQSSTYFSHQYPTAPASAVPAHLNRHSHSSHVPTTYRSATANNLLTDNASILTLASSSGRNQRRNSLDTDASIRAIRPSSTFGGSRESLPLSVLSQNAESNGGPALPTTAGLHQAQSRGLERASVYSSNGIGVGAPMLSSERNSIYAGKTGGCNGVDGSNGRVQLVDSSSVKSGRLDHGRNHSTAGSAGSIGGYNVVPGAREGPADEEPTG